MNGPCFTVRESSGGRIVGGHNLVTHFYVLDRAYCHRVIHTFSAQDIGTVRCGSTALARERAASTAARLNAEHDAWAAA